MPADIELETLERRGSFQSDPERRSNPDGNRLDREYGNQLAKGDLGPWAIFGIAFSTVAGTSVLYLDSRALYIAGPGGALLAFGIVGLVAICVMECVSELLQVFPTPNAIAEIVGALVDEDLAWVIGVAYWFTYASRYAILIAWAASFTDYWHLAQVYQVVAFYVIAAFAVFAINNVWASTFGLIAAIGATLKIIMIFATGLSMYIIYDQSDIGSKFINDGFKYKDDVAHNARVAVCIIVPIIAQGFLGVETVLVTASQAKGIRSIQQSSKYIAYCVFGLYFFGIIGEMLNVQWTDQALLNTVSTDPNRRLASRAVVVIAAFNAGKKKVAGVLNGSLILSALITANCSLYVASLNLHHLLRNTDIFTRIPMAKDLGKLSSKIGTADSAKWISFIAFLWLPFLRQSSDVAVFYLFEFIKVSGTVICLLIWNVICFAFLKYYFWFRNNDYLQEVHMELYRLARSSRSSTLMGPYQPLPAIVGLVGSNVIIIFTTATWWDTEPTVLKVVTALGAYIVIIVIVWISKTFSRRPPVKLFASPQDLDIMIGRLRASGQRPRKRREVQTSGGDQMIRSKDKADIEQPMKGSRQISKLEPKQVPDLHPPDHDLLSDEQAMKDLVAFLALFGEEGVSLRELTMLACYRYLEPPPQSGLLRGEGNGVYRRPDWNCLRLFAYLARTRTNIEVLRNRLLTSGSIEVILPVSDASDVVSDWPDDDEIWTHSTHIRVSRPWQSVEAACPGPHFNWSLLQTFTMASQTFEVCLEDRLNQILTQYGRIAESYLTKEMRFAIDTGSWWSWEGEGHAIASYINFILNLIIHHTRPDDSKLLNFVHALVKTEGYDDLILVKTEGYDDLIVDQFGQKLLWAELKAAAAGGRSEDVQQGLVAVQKNLRDKMSRESEDGIHDSFLRALEATMLADLLQSLQAAGFISEWHSLRNLGREWCSVALKAPTDSTIIAACKLIPQLDSWHRLAQLPTEYHMECAHQLSRLGYVQLAWRFFRSGQIDDSANVRSVSWRVRTDYVAIALHLGQVEEAKKELLDLLTKYQNARERRSGPSNYEFLVGDIAEQGLTIYCLLSDILVTEGKFVEAEATLSHYIKHVKNMQEEFIASMRLAMRSRLMKIQLHLGASARASTTCVQQHNDVLRFFKSTGRSTTLQWTMDELIATADEMADQGQDDYSLEVFKAMQAEHMGSELPDLADMTLYVQSRVKYLSQLPAKANPSKETKQQHAVSWSEVDPNLLLQSKGKRTDPDTYSGSEPGSFTRTSSLDRETDRLELPVAGPKTDQPLDASLSFKDRKERYQLMMRRLLRLQPPPKTDPGLKSRFPAVPQTKITEPKAEKQEPSVAIPL